MLGSTALGLADQPIILAVGFTLLLWLLAEWTARRDAEALVQAEDEGLSRAQGAVIAGLAALWIIFRGDDDDD